MRDEEKKMLAVVYLYNKNKQDLSFIEEVLKKIKDSPKHFDIKKQKSKFRLFRFEDDKKPKK